MTAGMTMQEKQLAAFAEVERIVACYGVDLKFLGPEEHHAPKDGLTFVAMGPWETVSEATSLAMASGHRFNVSSIRWHPVTGYAICWRPNLQIQHWTRLLHELAHIAPIIEEAAACGISVRDVMAFERREPVTTGRHIVEENIAAAWTRAIGRRLWAKSDDPLKRYMWRALMREELKNGYTDEVARAVAIDLGLRPGQHSHLFVGETLL